MRTFTMLLAIVILGSSAAAQAQDDVRLPLAVSLGASYDSGGFGRTTFQRGGTALTIRYDLTSRLALRASYGLGFMRMAFAHSPTTGLSARGLLWSPAESSGSVGASYALLLDPRYRLDLTGSMETSLPGVGLAVSRLNVTTPDGTFDVSSFSDAEVHPALFWRKLEVSTEFRMALGRFEPMLGIGFMQLTAAIDLRLSQAAAATLRSLGYGDGRIERRYAAAQAAWLVPMRAGLGYRPCPLNFFDLGTMFAPGGGPLFNINLTYTRSW